MNIGKLPSEKEWRRVGTPRPAHVNKTDVRHIFQWQFLFYIISVQIAILKGGNRVGPCYFRHFRRVVDLLLRTAHRPHTKGELAYFSSPGIQKF